MSQRKGFTLIELLVVVAIIALIATFAVVSLLSARARSRDTKRVADIRQMQTALALYFTDHGAYPETSAVTPNSRIASASNVYMEQVPTPPQPSNDGNCPANVTAYTYTQQNSGASYTITYCLGDKTGDLSAGAATATPGAIKINPSS